MVTTRNSTRRWPLVIPIPGKRLKQGELHLTWMGLIREYILSGSEATLLRSPGKKGKSGLRSLSVIFLFLMTPLLMHGATEPASQAAHEYRLRFYHTHTGERLDVVYRRGDQYIPEALDELDHFLRDHRTGDVHHYDPRLFDLLHDLTASLSDSGGEIDVICGYRTPWSNEFLRTRSPHTGVAQHSLHMQAEAIDIRLPGIPTSELRDAALRLHRGGVGYYRSSDFVHVDVGPMRHW
jgi:uncharacterized protein YcbK (DUF882 family)